MKVNLKESEYLRKRSNISEINSPDEYNDHLNRNFVEDKDYNSNLYDLAKLLKNHNDRIKEFESEIGLER